MPKLPGEKITIVPENSRGFEFVISVRAYVCFVCALNAGIDSHSKPKSGYLDSIAVLKNVSFLHFSLINYHRILYDYIRCD